jgi:hypothetical protein
MDAAERFGDCAPVKLLAKHAALPKASSTRTVEEDDDDEEEADMPATGAAAKGRAPPPLRLPRSPPLVRLFNLLLPPAG